MTPDSEDKSAKHGTRTTVILANGDFPREGALARNILENAERVIACDGAADAYFRIMHHAPDIVVGDAKLSLAGFVAPEPVCLSMKMLRFARFRGFQRLRPLRAR